MLREHIIRGARAGSILLLLLLAAYAGYRVMHEASAGATAPKSTPPEHAAPVAARVPVSTAGPAVPPPPPPRARKPPNARVQTPVAQSDPAPEPPSADKEPDEAAKSDLVEKGNEEKQPAAVQPVEPQQEQANEDQSAPADYRGKRWLKAVGRFLHVSGRKDARPPQI